MRKRKPNPLLETVVLAKERANLALGLLSKREPDAFEGLPAAENTIDLRHFLG
ncbi:MAG: hypothetical protein HSCHL_0467 [Hydrogenibacillus schlegelii]|uniref:Uncharacterized protein n=1 Tax=Hydrogenibacillus schlegelii TaxID=1484 RepID=A0A2T5G828_HYDSH|nr:hypothetical protein [Hydrogenibacillus schlegelii]PTQ52341.1 MAG: hypothetical protein HSCHL_0467 [Hydrogenibacillus schlegelii]